MIPFHELFFFRWVGSTTSFSFSYTPEDWHGTFPHGGLEDKFPFYLGPMRSSSRARWFKATFSSPSWRSLNPVKGSVNHPKKTTKNCQGCMFSRGSGQHFELPSCPQPRGNWWCSWIGPFVAWQLQIGSLGKPKEAHIFWGMDAKPLPSMYGIFTYIYHILPLKTT